MFAGWLWCRERIWRRQHQQKTHATASTSAHLPETTHWSLYSYVSLFDCWLLVYDYKYTWSRMMKFKLREAMRSGKISPEMFDRDEGTRRQNLFLKDQREQRRLRSIQFGLLSKSDCSYKIFQIRQADAGQGEWEPLRDGSQVWEANGCRQQPGRDEVCLQLHSCQHFLWGFSSTSLARFSLRFILNDVSSAMGEGRAYQTVQTGTCEAKGPSAPCGGGGFFNNVQNLILLFNSSLNNQRSMWWRR